MTNAVDGITDTAWDALLERFGTARQVFEAASLLQSKPRHGLRVLAIKRGIDPDAA